MTVTQIMPPSGLSRIVDALLDAVRRGLRAFARGGAHANAPAGLSLSLLCRLTRILRCAFVILALHVTLAPVRARTPGRRLPSRVRLYSPGFRLFPTPLRISSDDTPRHSQPAVFARATRDRVLAIRRTIDALSRALADPMPLIRRMARRLPTQLMVFGWRLPKRPPPLDRRDYWEELVTGFHEARFALGNWRRRRTDIARAASASG